MKLQNTQRNNVEEHVLHAQQASNTFFFTIHIKSTTIIDKAEEQGLETD